MISTRQRIIVYFFLILAFLFITPVVQAMPSDIKGHWAEESVRNLEKKGILNGYPDGTFRPDQSITRAEMAKILSVAYNFKTSNQLRFPDTEEHWAKEYKLI